MTQLAFDTIESSESPDRVAWILHGILGSGRNWRSVARRLVQQHPHWQVVLPDLRNHGRTGSAPPPHRIDDCVADLDTLPDPDLVIGHSFGGKVALGWAETRGTSDEVWVLDSVPFATAEGVSAPIQVVQEALRSSPTPFLQRSDARVHLEQHGLPAAQVAWLLTSLVRGALGWEWVYHLAGIDLMMEDYYQRDFSSFLSGHSGAPHIHLVRASRNTTWTPEVLERLRLGDGASLKVLPNSDHWVHVDNPDGLVEMLAPSFR